jgi:hypothetical protein
MKELLKKGTDMNDSYIEKKLMSITNDNSELLDDYEIEWYIHKRGRKCQ